MSKPKDKPKKPRADKYEEKVSFRGTFEQMVKISVKDADKKAREKKN
jgi:hypothetical protein